MGSSEGGEAVLKPESFPIDKIYVPVKRRKAIRPEVVREIAESILEVGQQTPILVRPDEDRFVLVEGLHRLEACKALGEPAIIGQLVSAEEAHQKAPSFPGEDAEREKMERLKKLRLEREAAEKTAVASTAAGSAVLSREHQRKAAGSSRPGREAAASRPKTLSEWIKQRERDGGRY
jgi:ParB/RepB/Spo0J family partition protein